MKHRILNRELYEHMKKAEEGVPPPVLLSLNLPYSCPYSCKFCGMNIYRNLADRGQSDELDYVIRAFSNEFHLQLEDIQIKKLLGMDVKDIKNELTSSAVGDLLEDIERKASETNIVTLIVLPYEYIGKIKRSETTYSKRELALIAAFLVTQFGRMYNSPTHSSMKVEDYIRIIKEAGDMGVSIVSIAGLAEPMAIPEYTIPLMKAVKENGMKGSVTTSGNIINSQIIDLMVELNWDWITLSMDAATDRTREYIRGVPEAFSHMDKFIKAVNTAKEKVNSHGPVFNMNYVITDENYQEVLDAIKYLEKVGAESINFVPMWLFSRGAEDMKMTCHSRNKFREMLEKNRPLWEESTVKNNLSELMDMEQLWIPTIFSSPPGYESVERDLGNFRIKHGKDGEGDGSILESMCASPWYELTIEASGAPKICSCSILGYSTQNARKDRLDDIWYGAEWSKLRHNFTHGIYTHECTEYCSYYPDYYPKLLMKEYKQARKEINEKKELPSAVAKLVKYIDSGMWHLVRKRPLENWLLRNGWRMHDWFPED